MIKPSYDDRSVEELIKELNTNLNKDFGSLLRKVSKSMPTLEVLSTMKTYDIGAAILTANMATICLKLLERDGIYTRPNQENGDE